MKQRKYTILPYCKNKRVFIFAHTKVIKNIRIEEDEKIINFNRYPKYLQNELKEFYNKNNFKLVIN